jgi:ubiquinone/menaquinone biosynthesis C-methylase UbiE
LLSDRLKGFFRTTEGVSPAPPSGPYSPKPRPGAAVTESVTTRHSRGLEQFFAYIRDQSGLKILDLAGASQENLSFLTSLGHRVSTQDFVRSFDETFGSDDAQDQGSVNLINYFLTQNLDFPDDSFDGVLLWDVLQYLPPAVLTAAVDRLARIVRPRSYMLAFFNADDKATTVPATTFRIQDAKNLILSQRGTRKQAQLFNNRSLEKLFGQFESVKFFLTRENLREVIVKR